MPVATAVEEFASTSVIGRAGLVGATPPTPFGRTAAVATSSIVPHSPHSGQRPTHLATVCPQAVHRNDDFGFATPLTLMAPADTHRRRAATAAQTLRPPNDASPERFVPERFVPERFVPERFVPERFVPQNAIVPRRADGGRSNSRGMSAGRCPV
ncbi:hypothetical protein GORHZ_213_00740 [Gordonia rhizosphera NBRC 16068]|uniref:Uncharacterized protein n=1 Tax=Gordonia rhizosphera NBRC 16068 TaxID=1108045 RepID=K6VAT8_9ACTN|nr:hypothetical protein GORHZ_213_00740 [Gordonia rhizosphera NBRC 16068]